jgi:hypothetical protein
MAAIHPSASERHASVRSRRAKTKISAPNSRASFDVSCSENTTAAATSAVKLIRAKSRADAGKSSRSPRRVGNRRTTSQAMPLFDANEATIG